jgi:hypothetical protein
MPGPPPGAEVGEINWEAVGMSQEAGSQLADEFAETMGFNIWEGPGTPEENLGRNIANWTVKPEVMAEGVPEFEPGDWVWDEELGDYVWDENAGGAGAWQQSVFGSPAGEFPGAPGIPGVGAGGFGPFASQEQWAAQFEAEHGRAPNETDMTDAFASFDFLAQFGRAPTQEEWENRYWTGSWFPDGGGWGWGGGGGGGNWNNTFTPDALPWWYTHQQKGI